MTDHILIDANSIGYAAHQGTTLHAGDQETQAVYGFIRAIRAIKVRNPDAVVVCLWDGRSWRKEISEVYKANRTDTADKREAKSTYTSQTPFIRRALKHLGVAQMAAANLEADDLAAMLVRNSKPGDFTRLISGDKDWLQLVSPTCIWEDHRDSAKRVNADSFKAVTGYPDVVSFLQSKALTGDVSDNLPGVGGIGDKGADTLLMIWGRVEAFLIDPDPAQNYKNKMGKNMPKAFLNFHQDVDERHAKFYHNLHMMSLIGDLPAPERLTLNKGEFDADAFKSICHELGFNSIFRPDKFDQWVEPFRPVSTNV
jgi:5'-3' exonuclease